ncbi:multiheme c-type cytochrome [Paracidobacterium acidisoli]|uniref:Cytochrome c-552/4 domain-containing protein n=1 Tax=Paracidobacterium acidisoli TaxID=2303751 RepID=A0A372IJF2_9BACT|nr:multiheme c-type cytochrome [Paracidobacterium acidisoli]MBT9332973.1 hypothetical protein [Paracidobacterium acidisoli]
MVATISAELIQRAGSNAIAGHGAGFRRPAVALQQLALAANVVISLMLVCSACPAPALSMPEQELSATPRQTQAAGESSPDRARYVGDAACSGCHKDISLSYLHTAHHLTSQLASRISVLGPFEEPRNEVKVISSTDEFLGLPLLFRMEAKSDGFYETAYETIEAGDPSQIQTFSKRIDIVTGSGVRGQTYLYWQGSQLFELPISYWTGIHKWINSPGYENGTADFSRPVYPRCLECHATYIRPLSSDPLTNRYDVQSLIPGISCETCHGPGADHVEMQKAASARSADQHILNPAKFSRDRQIDLCALCHNGAQREERAPAFTYLPGRPLDRYLRPEAVDMPTHPNVHGNQVGLLEKSLCYRSSPTMSCSTCHDVHATERSAAFYSQRCLTCHRVESCGMSKKMGRSIANNCIDCHMPVQPTSAIVSVTGNETVRASMRTHWIRVYRDNIPASEQKNRARP